MTFPSSAFNSGGQFAWDNTSINLYKECPRKYFYRMIENLAPKKKSVHLEFGGWYAKALERFHKLRAAGTDFDDAVRAVVRKALVDTWEYGYKTPADAEAGRNPIPGTGAPWKSHDAKNRFTLIRSIVWYLDHFREDTMETHILSTGEAAVEFSFKLPFGDREEYIYCGHIDRLVKYGDDIYIQDQKTTGTTLSPYYFEQYKTDAQMSGYTFAGKIIYNIPIRGVVIDAAQIAQGFTQFSRAYTYRTENQLNEWYSSTLYWIERARDSFQRNEWPMNTSSCGNYGGCTYRDVCGRCPAVRKQFIKGDFTTKHPTWNPLVER